MSENNRKKWCEVCKMLIPYTRSAIQDHERTAKHRKNKEIDLRNQNKQARKEKKSQNKALDTLPYEQQSKRNQNNDTRNEMWEKQEIQFTGETEEQKKKVEDQLGFYGEGKIWIFEREDDTQRLRFRNSITGEIKYDKPFGLLLEDFEEEVWEENLRQPQGPQLNQNMKVNIGEWEIVKQEDTFLNKFKIEESEEEEVGNEENQMQNDIVEKIQNGQIQNQQDLVKEVLMNGEDKSNRNLFKEKLRKLADKDIELDDLIPRIEMNKERKEINSVGLFNKKKKAKIDYF